MNKMIREYFEKMGSKGGKTKTAAKAKASRENGKKGGRPKGKAMKNVKLALFLITMSFSTGCQSLDRLMNGREHKQPSPIAQAPLPTLDPNAPESSLTGQTSTTHEIYLVMGQSLAVGVDGDFLPAYPGVTGINRGPAYAFAVERAKKGHTVHIIQTAMDGSQINMWQPGQGLYITAMNQARGNQLTGVIYAQGEADASRPDYVNWKEGFENLVQSVRSELGQPNLPFIYSQIGNKPSGNPAPNYDRIKAEQASIRIHNVRMITIADIPQSNGWHLFTEGYNEMGKRMEAQAWW